MHQDGVVARKVRQRIRRDCDCEEAEIVKIGDEPFCEETGKDANDNSEATEVLDVGVFSEVERRDVAGFPGSVHATEVRQGVEAQEGSLLDRTQETSFESCISALQSQIFPLKSP